MSAHEKQNDVAIIIQGPLSPISLQRINYYRQCARVIVSCWEGDPVGIFDGVTDITVVQSKPLHNLSPQSNPQNILRQIETTLAGLLVAKEHFCIKVRSDEYFSNLVPVLDHLRANPTRFVTTNVYFSKRWRLHVSDHLLAGKREIFVTALQWLKGFLSQGNDYHAIPPEVLLTCGILTALNETFRLPTPGIQLGGTHPDMVPNSPQEIELLTRHFGLVPVAEMAPYLVKLITWANVQGIKQHKHFHLVSPELMQGCVFNSLSELSV